MLMIDKNKKTIDHIHGRFISVFGILAGNCKGTHLQLNLIPSELIHDKK